MKKVFIFIMNVVKGVRDVLENANMILKPKNVYDK